MRINNINIGRNSNIFNIDHTVGRLSQNKLIPNNEQQEQKDIVSVSSLGKIGALLKNLINQKQNIIEIKDSLISRTLEKGESMDCIKSELEYFENQLKNIDTQITKTMANISKRQAEKKAKTIYSKPKSEKEVESKRVNSLINLSTDLKQMQDVLSVKANIDGEARVLEAEIKKDESRGGASDLKIERLSKLRSLSTNITAQISDSIAKVNKEIKDNNENQAFKHKDTEIDENEKRNKNQAISATTMLKEKK